MQVEEFIRRWTGREGGAERANYQMFLSELCDVIGVPRPEPAGAEREHNDYVFGRAVRRRQSDDINASKRIDLYKKGCFILEAKQSRLPGGKNEIPGQKLLFGEEPEQLGRVLRFSRPAAFAYLTLLTISINLCRRFFPSFPSTS